eukprot:jgi/Mesvir1/22427/Mv17902-RA.1
MVRVLLQKIPRFLFLPFSKYTAAPASASHLRDASRSFIGRLEAFRMASCSDERSMATKNILESTWNGTKIVCTLGPASSSREVIREMILAGMDVARLNFSHGDYESQAARIALIREISAELKVPVTLLQDLQGPKIRVSRLPGGLPEMTLTPGARLHLVPEDRFVADASPPMVSIDYPHLVDEAVPGMKVLLDDGLLELRADSVDAGSQHVACTVVRGGVLKLRKGVNLPSLSMPNLPALTEKDKRDLKFGVSQGVHIMCLSFVRKASDLREMRSLLDEAGWDGPVMVKIEKPQAIDNLDEILREANCVMVARGDLGVEMPAEQVPVLQKRIIRACNDLCKPVITATQMLDSMVNNAIPTRAEVCDVVNAVIDGTDAVMLSAESATGKYPVLAVQTLVKLCRTIENDEQFYRMKAGRRAMESIMAVESGIVPTREVPSKDSAEGQTSALSAALSAIDMHMNLRCIVCFTSSGYSALIASGERPRAPVVALTTSDRVAHGLNLVWGVKPLLIADYCNNAPAGPVRMADTFEGMISQAESLLVLSNYAKPGDLILIVGGVPANLPHGTNFFKIHVISQDPNPCSRGNECVCEKRDEFAPN